MRAIVIQYATRWHRRSANKLPLGPSPLNGGDELRRMRRYGSKGTFTLCPLMPKIKELLLLVKYATFMRTKIFIKFDESSGRIRYQRIGVQVAVVR